MKQSVCVEKAVYESQSASVAVLHQVTRVSPAPATSLHGQRRPTFRLRRGHWPSCCATPEAPCPSGRPHCSLRARGRPWAVF